MSGAAEDKAEGTNSRLNSVLTRNIEALQQKHAEEERQADLQVRLADRITAITGSMPFVYGHLLIVAAWITINVGWVSSIAPFDPTFVILATAASVEAIFLSTFVLISQNRAAAVARRRAELDLQTVLLSEYEVTRILRLVISLGARLGVKEADDPSLNELQAHIEPERVLDKIEKKEE